jgi:hypothetical protein
MLGAFGCKLQIFIPNIKSGTVLNYSKNAKKKKHFINYVRILTSEKCVINKILKPEGRRSDA